ncbi:MAG: hypothetical protein U9N60_03205 [Thermodesulfobacteriota bacterium]|nr:hypothetical protein [Thermodesulfobacteriota bacterium]
MPRGPVGLDIGTSHIVMSQNKGKHIHTVKQQNAFFPDPKPISINEGLATVMSELAHDNFTGIGISMGGGMCNVCLS